MVSLGPLSTNHDQNKSDYRSELHIPDYRSVKQMQIGNLNNFSFDRVRMEQDLLQTYIT